MAFRSQREWQPRLAGPCQTILAAGDDATVEVMGASIMLKAPYNSSGLGLRRTLTVLGCQGPEAERLKNLEATLEEALLDPARAAKLRISGLTNLGSVRRSLL